MFNPAIQTKIQGKHFGLFITLLLTFIIGITFFSNSSITGAVLMESGEVSSFEPIFIAVGVLVVLILLSLFWWWLNKKKEIN